MNELVVEIDRETGNAVVVSDNTMGIKTNISVDSVTDEKITLKIVSMRSPIQGPF